MSHVDPKELSDDETMHGKVPRLDLAVVGLRHPHAIPGHEPVGWTDTLSIVPELNVVATCEATEAGRAAAAQHLPHAPVYQDITTMLRKHPEVRAALVLLPNDEMGPALTALAEAGIHVALDKPGARTAADLARALHTIREQRLVSAVAYLWRMKPIGLDARRLVMSDDIGQVWSIDGRMIATSVQVRGAASPLFSREASGGGILHWLGCHWLDLVRFVTDSEITSVAATTDNLGGQDIDVEDFASVTMRLDNGAMASLVTGYLLPSGYRSELSVHGQDGWFAADMSGRSLATHLASDGHTRVAAPYEERPELRAYGGQAGVDFLRAFSRAVSEAGVESPGELMRKERAPRSADRWPFATLEDAARVLAVIEAAYASTRQGGSMVPTARTGSP